MIFEDRKVRRVLHGGEWSFVVADVVAALTGSLNPRDSWDCLKKEELAVCGVDLSELCRWLEVEDVDGRKHREETATLEGIFRIVQSVSSPRAEVFKRWLARVGQERKDRQGYRTDLASIFSMLDEAATAAIVCRQNDQGLDDYGIAVRKGGRIVEEARERLEQETGDGVVASGKLSRRIHASAYAKRTRRRVLGQRSGRDDKWTDSLAVGSKDFVDKVKAKLGILAKGRDARETEGGFQLREPANSYPHHFEAKKDDVGPENTYFLDVND